MVLGYDDVMNWWETIWLAYTRTQTSVTYGSPDVDSIEPAQTLESRKTYKWYVVAGASTPDVPSDVNWDTWVPNSISFSGSEVRQFTVQ